MTTIDIFGEEWSREAIDKEMELGGIRIGPLKPLGISPVEDAADEEETLQREETMLKQKLTHQLAQMKEREASSREYLRKYGIVPELEIQDGARVYAGR